MFNLALFLTPLYLHMFKQSMHGEVNLYQRFYCHLILCAHNVVIEHSNKKFDAIFSFGKISSFLNLALFFYFCVFTCFFFINTYCARLSSKALLSETFFHFIWSINPYKQSVLLWDIVKQCRTRSDAAYYGV